MKTILIADDEPVLRVLVRTTLEEPGVRIFEAHDGESALELIARHRPDVLLLDWMMPGLSGVQVLERLRGGAGPPELRVIMLTARSQAKDRELAVAAGCDHFLTKPFSPLELLDIVQRVLRSTASAPARAPAVDAPALTAEHFARLEEQGQLALYARDLKRAYDEQQERARQLAQANERLDGLSRLKTEFLSFVCHELRTPLNAMAALEIYDAGGEAREQAEVIDLARSGYQRLERFIDRGLQYFQWIALERIHTAKTTEPGRLLERVVAELPELRAPEVRFQLRRERDLGLVQGLEAHLAIVVRTLLENALRFSIAPKHVTAELRRRAGNVQLTISDQGVGLRPEMLSEVFQPLTSADCDHHTDGSGLSLALAAAIVSAHGGSIRAESPGLGLGSTFVVELPLLATAVART